MLEVLGKDKGIIYNIQRFSIHDGNGIRTLIFMKGCPLRCLWCCNPESQSITQEILFLCDRCIGCNNCVRQCPFGFLDIDREKCIKCGMCTQVCPSNAKRLSGRYVTVGDLLHEVEKDRLFYRNSGGGVTISGGEPTMQHEFVSELARRCQNLDVETAIETCGYNTWDNMKMVLDYMDEIFFDLKHMNPEKHKVLTGGDNALILGNAEKTAKLGKKLTFRLPLVPDCNDEEENIIATAEFISDITNENVNIEILPYHRLGGVKFDWLGKKYELSGTVAPKQEMVEKYTDIFKSKGCHVVKNGVRL